MKTSASGGFAYSRSSESRRSLLASSTSGEGEAVASWRYSALSLCTMMQSGRWRAMRCVATMLAAAACLSAVMNARSLLSCSFQMPSLPLHRAGDVDLV